MTKTQQQASVSARVIVVCSKCRATDSCIVQFASPPCMGTVVLRPCSNCTANERLWIVLKVL